MSSLLIIFFCSQKKCESFWTMSAAPNTTTSTPSTDTSIDSKKSPAAPAAAATTAISDYFNQWRADEIPELGAAMIGYVRTLGMSKVSCPFKVEYDAKRKWKGISSEFTSPTARMAFERGTPTVKYDGMNCLKVIHNGRHILLIRYDQKLSKDAKTKIAKKKLVINVEDPKCITQHFKAAPPYFVATESRPDPVTFHYPGYVPIFHPNTENAYQFEEYLRSNWTAFQALKPHTYELVGPDVNGNVHGFQTRQLLLHGAHIHEAVRTLQDKSLEGLLKWFQSHGPDVTSEGIVWHYHPPAPPTDTATTTADAKSAPATGEVLMV
jgi:hypothetical protein